MFWWHGAAAKAAARYVACSLQVTRCVEGLWSRNELAEFLKQPILAPGTFVVCVLVAVDVAERVPVEEADDVAVAVADKVAVEVAEVVPVVVIVDAHELHSTGHCSETT